jgi:hypothetical protein
MAYSGGSGVVVNVNSCGFRAGEIGLSPFFWLTPCTDTDIRIDTFAREERPMPKCTLYLSEEDQKNYKKIKEAGGNPSALFAKALRDEIISRDKNAAEMDKIRIVVGTVYNDTPEGDLEDLEPFSFYGRFLSKGVLRLDPQFNDNIMSIEQELYVTRKGNYLLHEKIVSLDRYKCRYKTFDKDKPIALTKMALEIVEALEVEDVGDTFLDI